VVRVNMKQQAPGEYYSAVSIGSMDDKCHCYETKFCVV
jgi:hypothetical protein